VDRLAFGSSEGAPLGVKRGEVGGWRKRGNPLRRND